MRKLLLALSVALSLCAQTTMRLADVRKVYIDKMDNSLDEYLRSSISKKFHGTLTVVLKREEADAILAGVNPAAQRTRTGTITLTDREGNVVLWSGTASDREGKFLDLKHGGGQKLADHLVDQMKKAMER